MKRVTASDARKSWFRILDEVADGEVVYLERGGRRIVIRAEPDEEGDVPDYAGVLEAEEVSDADRWGWSWDEEEGELTLESDAGDE